MEHSLFSFGVITDIQYANVDDGWDFHKTSKRYYRNSINLLKNAVQDWKNNKEISFIVQLGDLLDGINSKHKSSEESLNLLVDQFLDYKVYHLIGNHELYNFSRSELEDKLCYGYYHFSPHPQWRFILLDAFEFSTIQPETEESALHYLRQNNPNPVERSADWTQGLKGLDRRFMPYNGAVTDHQLEWLNRVLDEAEKEGQNVIILSHVPIAPGSCSDKCLLWNYDKVLQIVHSKSCVKAILAGHDHSGGFTRDEHGIYHCTFKAVLEAPLGKNAHCTIQVYSNKLVIKGNGIINDDLWMI